MGSPTGLVSGAISHVTHVYHHRRGVGTSPRHQAVPFFRPPSILFLVSFVMERVPRWLLIGMYHPSYPPMRLMKPSSSLQHQPPGAEGHLAPGQLQSEQRQVPQGQAGGKYQSSAGELELRPA